MDEKQQDELRRKMEENEILAESLKEKANIIFQKKVELIQSQQTKKKGKAVDDMIIHEETSKENYDDSQQSESRKKKKLKKKKKTHHNDDEDEEDNDEEVATGFKKLRKRQRVESEDGPMGHDEEMKVSEVIEEPPMEGEVIEEPPMEEEVDYGEN
jgi:hypothetical protein